MRNYKHQNDDRSGNAAIQLKVRPGLLRRMNERRILEAVQSCGDLSRAELVRQTGISPPTVSKLVRSLLDARLLEEGDAPGAVPGRPAKVVRLARTGTQILSALLDTKECCIAATGLDGQLREEAILRFSTPDSYQDLVRALVKHAHKLIPSGTVTLALGVIGPGIVDRIHQQVLLSANLHILDGRFPARDLAKRLKIPAILLHDTDALCLAERTFGQARGMDNFVIVDATSGLGAAIMTGGQLMPGHNGLAGEIGHITVEPHGRRCGCGKIGCLETVATDAALAAILSEKAGRPLNITEAIDNVRSGTLDAEAEIEQTLEYLAIGVATVINIFNPAAVVVQAQMFDVRDDALDRFLAFVGKHALSPALSGCKIVRGSGSKLQGAVAGTIHHLTTVLGPKV